MYKIKCNQCQAIAVNGSACHESGCHGVMEYTFKNKTYKKYTVWSVECWGNDKDGYEMNDRAKIGVTLLLPIDSNDKDIIKLLKKEGLLNKRIHFKSISINGDENLLCIDSSKTGEQLYQLEAN